MPSKYRIYSQKEYDEATRRISKLININTVDNLRELNKRISENLLDDIKNRRATIYENLKKYWENNVKSSVKEKTTKLPRTPKEPVKRRFIKERRKINRTNGIEWLKQQNRLRKGLILHKSRYHKPENLVIYPNRKSRTGTFITRRKPVRKRKP